MLARSFKVGDPEAGEDLEEASSLKAKKKKEKKEKKSKPPKGSRKRVLPPANGEAMEEGFSSAAPAGR